MTTTHGFQILPSIVPRRMIPSPVSGDGSSSSSTTSSTSTSRRGPLIQDGSLQSSIVAPEDHDDDVILEMLRTTTTTAAMSKCPFARLQQQFQRLSPTPTPYQEQKRQHQHGAVSPIHHTRGEKKEGTVSALETIAKATHKTTTEVVASAGATAAATATAAVTIALSPWEVWWLTHLDQWYHTSQKIHCPFWRRRLGDSLDQIEPLVQYLIIRRDAWPLLGPPRSWRTPQDAARRAIAKQTGVSVQALQQVLYHDWKAATTHKGYYVTGRLTTSIYRNDCIFDGPDPDMPIRGLRKYMGVASHLFDPQKSHATLLSLEQVQEEENGDAPPPHLLAHWELQGVLKLPWRPSFPTFRGTTRYYLDADGLIERHVETWDVSVAHAFCHTLWPQLAKQIWKNNNKNKEQEPLPQQLLPRHGENGNENDVEHEEGLHRHRLVPAYQSVSVMGGSLLAYQEHSADTVR
jgi:hypothetical protein